jgi:hypothetical protein
MPVGVDDLERDYAGTRYYRTPPRQDNQITIHTRHCYRPSLEAADYHGKQLVNRRAGNASYTERGRPTQAP